MPTSVSTPVVPWTQPSKALEMASWTVPVAVATPSLMT